jgi:pyrimidine/purine-5'-nucleotide nucleosidase
VTPTGSLENLSQQEVDRLLDSSRGGLYELYRRCSLAVLNSGGETDDARAIFERYADFDIRIERKAWGVKLDLRNAPAGAFVDGRMIRGIQEHLFAVLRDILYIHGEVYHHGSVELTESQGITDAVYRILRNAGLLRPRVRPDVVVCWGGHSISREEYNYTKKVGYELGLRGLNVCTGCGPGAMKGPMKGATIGHSKQRIRDGRYIGVTEPGIVAAEPPNAIVNQLVILPDIEKRLEAFVRTGHGIVVFPGGAGTAEEILYLLGILLHPDNAEQPFPVVFTGPAAARSISARSTSSSPPRSVRWRGSATESCSTTRPRWPARCCAAWTQYASSAGAAATPTTTTGCSAYPHDLQQPFEPTHEAMATLEIRRGMEPHRLAAQLRRAFSGSSPATSRKRASAYRGSGARSKSTASPSCCAARCAAGVVRAPAAHEARGRVPPCYRLVA